MVKGILAGSFDPIHYGHVDLMKRSKRFCDQLVLAIGINAAKKTLFTEEERLRHLQMVVDKEIDFLTGVYVSVASFDGLLVDYAHSVGATLLIRGVRTAADFDYETNLAQVNRFIAPGLETILLPTHPELAVCSSSAIKEIARHGGPFESLLPAYLISAIREKLGSS